MSGIYLHKKIRIDLSTEQVFVERIDDEDFKSYIGGRGLGVKWLSDRDKTSTNVSSPDHPVIFVTGPLSRLKAATAGRSMIVTKHAMHQKISCSNSSGAWGVKLKDAGYDAIIVEGKADRPVYLYIDEHSVELHDAKDLQGKLTSDIDQTLKQRYGSHSSSIYIGPAGDRRALISCVMNDKERAAGRGGIGAILGSKNLKAITIVAEQKPLTRTELHIDEYLKSHAKCFRCPIGCGRYVNIDNRHVVGPEHKTQWALGKNLLNDDEDTINRANELSNEYGLDTLATASTIATAMQLYEDEKLSDEVLDGGHPLLWGSSSAILDWIRRIGEGSDPLAQLMAQGSEALYEHFGQNAKSKTSTENKFVTKKHTAKAKVRPGKFMAAAIDAMGLCLFSTDPLDKRDYAKLLSEIRKEDITEDEFMSIGERIYNLEKQFVGVNKNSKQGQ